MAQLHKRKGGVFDDTAAAGDQPGDHVHLARLAKLLGANASAPGAGATQADIAGTPQAAALPAASAVVYSGNLSDYVLSADGLTTYVAGQDGTIRAYNAETGTLLQSWAITTNPGGLALSPDGGFLVVVETTPVSSTGSQWERLTTVVAHRIDLGTGAVTSFPFVATGYDDAFADVEILADGRAYFSQYFAGSGFTSIWALDFSTGQYQAILGNQKFAAPPALTSDPDSAEQLLLSITASSGGDQILVDISGGVPAVAASTSPLAGGFGIQAFSAEAGLIALRTSPGSKIYDTALHAITVPDAVRLLMNDATGLAFDSNGENLFLVHSSTGSIVQISTDSWQVVESFDLPDGAFTYNSHRGNELIIGPDARYFMILAGGMLMRIDNPTVADAITGTPGIDSLSGTAGNDVIIGYQSADVMTGFAGDDRYHVDTASDVVVEALGGGTDTVTTSVSYVLAADSEIEHLQTSNQLGSSPIELTGNALANRLTGNAAGNVLDGGEGNDELHGRGGNDRLEGGAGDDALNGGEGDDLLYGGEGADTAGGGAGNDSFFVDDLGDSTLEGAGEGNDTVWASVSYALTAGQHVEMLTFADAASTDPLDLTGNDLAQTITGNAGANRIDAGGGNDTLIGGGGADTLIGGTGDDVYRVEEAGDDVVEAVGSGSDTVYAVVSYALAAGSEVELLSAIDPASTGGMNLTGNELAQTIRGNAGDNQLSGGGGGDVLIGLGGNDFYFVGDVRDVVTEAAGGGNDRIFAGASHVLAAGSEVEILSTDFSPGTAAINLTGNALAQAIYGNAGANQLNGGGGADILAGFGGDDWYFITDGGEAVFEGAGGGNDRIFASVDYRLQAGAEVELLTTNFNAGTAGIDIIGNEFAQAIYGNAGANQLTGGGGGDAMAGLGGNDFFFVGDARDTIHESAGGGNDRVFASLSYTLTAGADVEMLTTDSNLGTAAINLTGNVLAQGIFGNAGANQLNGGGGADSLVGFAGDDWYFIVDGREAVFEGAGGGNDRIFAGVDYRLRAGASVEMITTDLHAGTASIDLIGNELAQLIYGNAGANQLTGGGGGDVLTGLGGDDFYFVGDVRDVVIEAAGGGSDRIFAGASHVLAAGSEVEILSTDFSPGTAAINLTGNALAQAIYGNAGANQLTGGGGGDVLIGLGGNDFYFAGDVRDVVIEAAGGGNDRIFAGASHVLAAGSEVEILSTDFSPGTAAINLTGNALAQAIYGNAGANQLNGGGGADILAGFGGDDWYFITDGGEAVFEGAGGGNDRIFASVSFTLAAGSEVEILSTDFNPGTAAINLTGNELANTIYGNDGVNVLDGKGGSDILIGFAGSDSFAFTTALSAGNVDTILDFASGSDKVQLDDAVFAQIGGLGALNANAFVIGTAAAEADDRIIYNAATGQLFYDADGNGAGAAVLFSTLTGSPALAASDFQVI